jgi:hypothetical protein
MKRLQTGIGRAQQVPHPARREAGTSAECPCGEVQQPARMAPEVFDDLVAMWATLLLKKYRELSQTIESSGLAKARAA